MLRTKLSSALGLRHRSADQVLRAALQQRQSTASCNDRGGIEQGLGERYLRVRAALSELQGIVGRDAVEVAAQTVLAPLQPKHPDGDVDVTLFSLDVKRHTEGEIDK